ncbi:MAG: polysaccharide biosynthesis/export family protein [Bacteroidales bacterium]|jgi:polysaccharide export outer membrane protein|nr:polysaccharide biosynthesis/export family protein [Bacteroidales bacterium]
MKYKFIVFLCCILFSCHTSKKVIYLQDAVDGTSEAMVPNEGITIQPKDILSIVITSKNPELSVSFNLPLTTYFAGSASPTAGESQKLLGFTVDQYGYIDYPILGRIKVAGLTRLQLSDMIKQRLTEDDLLKDPVVTTEFMNFRISILGEVANPGTYQITNDKITLLEALGMAGDMTIYGNRENVMVVRETDYLRNTYRVDLRSKDLFTSPVYYLQQNDVIYVEPNKVRAGQSRINENKSVGVWVSIASLFATILVLFIK